MSFRNQCLAIAYLCVILRAMRVSKGVAFMALSIVSFSLMHACIKAIPRIPEHQIITFRSVFSILITLYVLKKEKIPLWGNRKGLLILRGLVGVLSLFCFFYSIKHLPLATAVTISNLIPLFTLLLAAVFLREKVTLWHWLFLGISFSGVMVVKQFDARVDLWQLLVALGAAFFAACAHFLVRSLRNTEHSMVIVFYFPLVTLPLIGPYTAWHWVPPQGMEWAYLLLIGLFTHIGQVYLTQAYKNEEVSGVTFVYFIGILLSLAYGYMLFDEVFTWPTGAGMALIALGIWLNLMYKSKRASHEKIGT